MLPRRQAEREDKTPTPEVSNYGLTSSNNPDESLGAITSSLRRRNVSVKSNSCVTSALDNNTFNDVSMFFDLSDSNLEAKAQNLRKRYPKLTASYPKILQNNNKIYPKDIKRRAESAFSKPPISQPPVFLKCKVKKKNSLNDNTEGTDKTDEKILSASSQTTDLDIQFSKLKLESFMGSDSFSESNIENNITSNSEAQTLKQYCNFEDKKVMRVAPHIRRKDVICDTVDAWSCENNIGQNVCESRYKPLVFGGTYPIDLPLRLRNNNKCSKDTVENMTLRH